MIKKIKESEAYEKFKQLRVNSQTKALMSLGMWLIFFVIIVMFTRGLNNNSPSNIDSKASFKLNNYAYTYTNDKITIFGLKYGDSQLFTISNSKYYYNGQNVYLINGIVASLIADFDLNILKITPEMIDNLTANLDYTENGEIKVYLVPLTNFINLYDIDTDVNLTLASNYNIIIQKYYNNNDLYKIDVDLSNYYMINSLNNDGKLTIDLYNKNKINNFSLEYDNMIGVG